MRIKSIRAAGFTVAVFLAAAAFVAIVLLGVAWWKALLTAALLFALGYALGVYAIRRYVIHRLKPIYQIVLSKDVQVDEIEDLSKGNPVDYISGEIATWAEQNAREIERLKENEKFRKEYVGNVSHEIKTPIFNIQGYIMTLLEGALEDEAINRIYLERAEKSVDRLINIVNDLEQISRFESGALNLKMRDFDVVELVHDAVDVVEMDAARKGVTIAVGNPDSAAQSVMVSGDKYYISQVLVNLLSNSIKYGVEGGHTNISFVDLFDKVMVEVSDDGVGIKKTDLPRVFERFWRADKSRSREQGGTGLGLAIVKHIIEAHGETVSVRSEPGRGTTFSFTLNKG